MHSATSAVQWHSNSENGLSHPWLRNARAVFRLQSGLSWQELSSPFFMWNTCKASRGMGKKFHAVCLSPFPMVWREPTDHVSDCYFCLTNISCVTAKSKHTVQYSNLWTAMRPVPHSEELPVPKPPTNMILSDKILFFPGWVGQPGQEESPCK